MKKKLTIKLLAQDDMPREKLMTKGASSLSNSELMAIIIGSGHAEMNAVNLSQYILDSSKNDLILLSKKSVKELCQYKGIGPAKAVSVLACFELAKRYRDTSSSNSIKQITCSNDAFQVLYPYLNGLNHEEFWCLFLSRSNKIISIENISKGGLHSSIVDLKLLFKKALLNESCGLIIAHNHPSGSNKPSKEDISITKKINTSASLIDMKLLDHLIFYNNTYISFTDESLL